MGAGLHAKADQFLPLTIGWCVLSENQLIIYPLPQEQIHSKERLEILKVGPDCL
jgi:hypothetical protein